MASNGLTGSEFALRVALCDLVERVKRSEDKCKYLELSRNEMAKEIVRLRHENTTLSSNVSRQGTYNGSLNLVLQNDQHNQYAQHMMACNQGNVSSPGSCCGVAKRGAPDCNNEDNDQTAAAEVDDESYEILTSRLLQECMAARGKMANNGKQAIDSLDESREVVEDELHSWDLVERAAGALARDYSQLAQLLSSQNDRLYRLKSSIQDSHYRTYFRKQIEPTTNPNQ